MAFANVCESNFFVYCVTKIYYIYMSWISHRNGRKQMDGFISRWASGITGQLDSEKEAIARAAGISDFPGLFEGDRRVKAKIITTKFGDCWILHDDEVDLIARRGKPFLPVGKNSRVHKDLGLRQGIETAPAAATLTGNGRGLSGAHSVHVLTFRTGCKWGSDATAIK